MEINSLPVELTVVWNGNFNIDNPAQNKGKELFQLVLGSGNLSNGPHPSLHLTKLPPSPCAVCCRLFLCTLQITNFFVLCDFFFLWEIPLFLPPAWLSLFFHHLCFLLLPTYFFFVCVFLPYTSCLLPLFISPGVMLFKLTRQESGHSLLRGDVVMNRGRERGRQAAALSVGRDWTKQNVNSKGLSLPPAQSLTRFNCHAWHWVGLLLTEGYCLPNPETTVFARDGMSIHFLLLLLVHHPQPHGRFSSRFPLLSAFAFTA